MFSPLKRLMAKLSPWGKTKPVFDESPKTEHDNSQNRREADQIMQFLDEEKREMDRRLRLLGIKNDLRARGRG